MAHLEIILKFDNVLDKFEYCEKNAKKKETKFGIIHYTFDDGSIYGVSWGGELIEGDVKKWEEKDVQT